MRKCFLLLLVFSFLMLSGCEEEAPSNPQVIENETGEVAVYKVKIDGIIHQVIEGEKAPLLTPNDTDDQIFMYWESDGEVFDVNTPITKNTVITAVYRERQTYKVYFDDEVVEVKEGFKVSKPANPIKEGYYFVDWFNEGAVFDFDTIITQDINLVSEWDKVAELGDLEYLSLGSIGGKNSVLWDAFITRTDNELVYLFETDSKVVGGYSISAFIHLGTQEDSKRTVNSIFIEAAVSGEISLRYYPNAVSTLIYSGENEIPGGIVTNVKRTEEKTSLQLIVPYLALSRLINGEEFSSRDVLGISFTVNNPNGGYDVWNYEALLGFNNKVDVNRIDPRDYIRISHNNTLFSYPNNSVDTFIEGNVDIADVKVSYLDKEVYTDENGYYSIELLSNELHEISLEFTKKGYKQVSKKVVLEDNKVQYECHASLVSDDIGGNWYDYELAGEADLKITDLGIRISDNDYHHALRIGMGIGQNIYQNNLVEAGIILIAEDQLGSNELLLESSDVVRLVTYNLDNNDWQLEADMYLGQGYYYEINNDLTKFIIRAYMILGDEICYSESLVTSPIEVAYKCYQENQSELVANDYLLLKVTADDEISNVLYGSKLDYISPSSREGMVFVGWYTADDKLWNFEEDIVLSPLVLISKWEKASYDLIIDGEYFGKVLHGDKLVLETPSKEGYDFLGYYVGDDIWNLETDTVDGPVSLITKWAVSVYTVTFETNGGTTIPSAEVKHGNLVAKPVNPVKEKSDFVGWYTQDGEAWNFETDVVLENLILYAKWETASYDLTIDGVYIGKVLHGDKLVLETPSKEGYDFLGYYVGDDKWNLETDTVDGPVSLITKWTVSVYEIKFETNGGTEIPSVEVEHGKILTQPANPSKDGNIFKGWSVDGGTLWDFETVITADLTLVALWELEQYTLTIDEQIVGTVSYGDKLVLETPSKEGYDFLGWFITDEEAWDLDLDVVYGPVELYTRWTIKTYVVKFNTNGAETIADMIIEHGSIVNEPSVKKDNYVLYGWYTENDLEEYDFASPVTSDMTLNVIWGADLGKIASFTAMVARKSSGLEFKATKSAVATTDVFEVYFELPIHGKLGTSRTADTYYVDFNADGLTSIHFWYNNTNTTVYEDKNVEEKYGVSSKLVDNTIVGFISYSALGGFAKNNSGEYVFVNEQLVNKETEVGISITTNNSSYPNWSVLGITSKRGNPSIYVYLNAETQLSLTTKVMDLGSTRYFNVTAVRKEKGLEFTFISTIAIDNEGTPNEKNSQVDYVQIYYQLPKIATLGTSRTKDTYNVIFYATENAHLYECSTGSPKIKYAMAACANLGITSKLVGNAIVGFLPYSVMGEGVDETFDVGVSLTGIRATEPSNWPNWTITVNGKSHTSSRSNPTTYVYLLANNTLSLTTTQTPNKTE